MTQLATLLEQHNEALLNFIRRNATGVMRFEEAEDLMQGAHVRALSEAPGFQYRGDSEFFAWIHKLIRNFIADRHAYWTAMKRGTGKVLRYTTTLGSGDAAGDRDPLATLLPPSSRTGPVSFSMRREMLTIVAKALAVLPERDRKFVQWMSDDVAIEEQARQLDLSYAAAQRAGLRAIERFQKAFKLVVRASQGTDH